MKSVCELLRVVGTSHDEVMAALENSSFKDFEDYIQSKCAKTANADYIVTRNADDFAYSEIPVLSPREFLKMM